MVILPGVAPLGAVKLESVPCSTKVTAWAFGAAFGLLGVIGLAASAAGATTSASAVRKTVGLSMSGLLQAISLTFSANSASCNPSEGESNTSLTGCLLGRSRRHPTAVERQV